MHVRTTWKGSLNVSLLSLRVKAYSTTAPQGETVQLHQLHAACQSRIRYHKVCPEHGEVPTDQIVMGYEQAPQQHVVIDLAELDRLRSQQQLRAIRIDTFVAAGVIGPLYFTDKHYYLLPDGPTAQLPYSLLVQAMGAKGDMLRIDIRKNRGVVDYGQIVTNPDWREGANGDALLATVVFRKEACPIVHSVSAQTAPDKEGSRPTLALDDATGTLSWYYFNLGDYNQDGLVTANIHRLGLPDKWIYQGSRSDQQAEAGIDAESIAREALRVLEALPNISTAAHKRAAG